MSPAIAIVIVLACIVAAYFMGRRDERARHEREYISTLRRWGL